LLVVFGIIHYWKTENLSASMELVLMGLGFIGVRSAIGKSVKG